MFLRLLTIFKPAFRWQVEEATQVYQDLGTALLPVTPETSRGIPNSEKRLPWHYVTRGNSIWRPLITCASVRWRDRRRNTLPCIRLIGTGNMLDCSLRFYALMANQSSTVPLDLLLCDWMKSAGLHDGRNGDPLPLGLADLGGSQHFSSTTPVFLAPSCSAPIAS